MPRVRVEEETPSSSTSKPEKDDEKKKNRIFLRSSSVGFAPDASENQKTKDVDDKRKRRESIKEHLLKFKAKAGKILDDTNSVKAEDSNQSIEKNDAKLDESSSEDRVLSPTSSRQSSSAEIQSARSVLRNRIRKNAQQAVERTRGNVQLNKRLARRPTVVAEENLNEIDVERVDHEIEKTIALGAKYVAEETGDLDEELPTVEVTAGTGEKVRSQLEFRGAREIDDRHDLLVASLPNRKIIVREVDGAPAASLKQSFHKIFVPEVEGVQYRRAEYWEDASLKMRKKFTQMDVFVDSVHFDHHHLWSEEDLAVSQMRNAYFAQLLRFHQFFHSSENVESPARENLLSEIRGGHEELKTCENNLKAVRERQGYSTSSFSYTPGQKKDPNDEDWTTMGKVGKQATTPVNKLPKQERERLKAMQKTSVRLILMFNDAEVSKTSWAPASSFITSFMRHFELEYYSPLQSLSLVVCEKQLSQNRIIGIAQIPILSEGVDDDVALHEVEFASTQDHAKTGTSLGAEEGRRECGRILCRAFKATADTGDDDDALPNFPEVAFQHTSFEAIPREVRLYIDPHMDDKRRIDDLRDDDQKRRRFTYRSAIDNQRLASCQYASLIRRRVMKRRQKREKKYEELVREQTFPSLSAAFSQLFAPADVSRKLKPMRREQTREHAGDHVHVFVNVQSATNLPLRQDNVLQPLVVVSFRGVSLRTAAVAGRHPNWQFSGKLLVEPGDDNCIQVRVYDEVVEQFDKDERLTNVVHEQLVHRQIAFATIRFDFLQGTGKVDANVRLHLPLFLTSYKKATEPSFLKILLSVPGSSNVHSEVNTFATSETPIVLARCEHWLNELKGRFPGRAYRPLVVDVNSKSVVPCRFLRPINPPPSVQQLDLSKSIATAAEIAAQIPHVDVPGQHDIWTTADQLTSIAVCGCEERAVLLACWLLHLQLPSYVLLGGGDSSAYVLANVGQTWLIVDATEGAVYATNDANCPMHVVYTVVGEKNIYANVQNNVHPSQMHFIFTKNAHWLPLLTTDPLDSMQPVSVVYTQISEDWVVELRSLIEREVKLKFDESRPEAIPQWNLVAARQLREILAELESKDGESAKLFVDEKLQRLRESYNVVAVAFKTPYTSIQKCVEEVLALQMHETKEKSAQFSFAVHLSAFFSHVVSLHFAVAILTPKK